MAHLIQCPHCTSSFMTIFSLGKVERCPYCARQVVHDETLKRTSGRAAAEPPPNHAPNKTPGTRALGR